MNSKKSPVPNFPRKVVYFEKQSNDRLCGLHALNNLLQGPYLDIVTLSEIGIQLNKMESELTGVKSSNNVGDDGNYNVQVLQKALNIYGADLKLLKKRQAISFLEEGKDKIEALLFNSSSHWYSIRKIDGIWFNLNSTNSLPGPEIISDFYLSAFIQGAEDIGYTNFLITNLPKLPELYSDYYKNLQPYQKLVKIEEIIAAKDLKIQKQKEREEQQKKKEEEAKKFQAFQGVGYPVDSQHHVNQGFNNFGDEDDDIQQAMKLSLQEFAKNTAKNLPPEPEKGYNIMVNYKGKFYKRKFNGTDKVGDIVSFVQSQIPTYSHLQLFESFPNNTYDKEEIMIKDSGMAINQMLMCKTIN